MSRTTEKTVNRPDAPVLACRGTLMLFIGAATTPKPIPVNEDEEIG